MSIESQILNQLIHNPDYGRAVVPHLDPKFFHNQGTRILFEQIAEHSAKFNKLPTFAALQIMAEKLNINDEQYQEVEEALNEQKADRPVDTGWLVKETETYCKDRAVENALRESIEILDDDKTENGKINDLLTKALSISFDSHIGHDYFEDASDRFDRLTQAVAKVPFSQETLNRVTKGGVEEKTFNLLIAGCVHPNTKVDVRYSYEGIERVRKVKAGEVKQLMEEGKVEILSNDGFVRISEFIEKGTYEEYVISTSSQKILRCNADHLVKSPSLGWITAEELMRLTDITATGTPEVYIETRDGNELASARLSGNMIPIVDFALVGEKKEYLAEGITSHNTNVGKSLILCNFAADYVLQGKNVLYITLEMAEEKIAQRIDANLIDIDLDEYEKVPKDWFLKQVSRVKQKAGGRIKIKEYPNGQAHAGHIRHLMKELELKEGFKADVLIVDYLNICSSSRYKAGSQPRHLIVGAIGQEIRALAQEFGIPAWSATQLNREGFGSSDAGITETSEAFQVNFDADLVWVVSEPEDLVELGQYQFKQEKSRYADKNSPRRFYMGVTKGRMKIFDLDENISSTPEEVSGDRFEDAKAQSGGEFFK